jgi:hypothetical protein
MAGIGICSNTEERCGLSFASPRLSRLFGLLRTIQHRRNSGVNADELLHHLNEYVDFYQQGEACLHCGGVLVLATRPTSLLLDGSPERTQVERQNQVLQAGYDLESMGILKF